MALNRPFGISPLLHKNGNTYNAQLTRYRIPSTDPSQYAVGDGVAQVAGADAKGCPNVQKWGGTAAARGVIMGIENPTLVNTSLAGVALNPLVGIPATKSQDYYVMVCHDPDILFAMQDDGITAGKLVAASANLNSQATITNPAQPFQLSASVLLSSSFAVTNTFPIKLMGLVQLEGLVGGGTPAFQAYSVWMCSWNNHELNGAQQVGI